MLNIFECHASIIPVDRTRNLLPGNGDLRPQKDREMGFCEFNQIRRRYQNKTTHPGGFCFASGALYESGRNALRSVTRPRPRRGSARSRRNILIQRAALYLIGFLRIGSLLPSLQQTLKWKSLVNCFFSLPITGVGSWFFEMEKRKIVFFQTGPCNDLNNKNSGANPLIKSSRCPINSLFLSRLSDISCERMCMKRKRGGQSNGRKEDSFEF